MSLFLEFCRQYKHRVSCHNTNITLWDKTSLSPSVLLKIVIIMGRTVLKSDIELYPWALSWIVKLIFTKLYWYCENVCVRRVLEPAKTFGHRIEFHVGIFPFKICINFIMYFVKNQLTSFIPGKTLECSSLWKFFFTKSITLCLRFFFLLGSGSASTGFSACRTK